jgi:pimeloyl-ACP methyl ester carboxylesterase
MLEPSSWNVATPLGCWLVLEVAFTVLFYTYMVPKANQRTAPHPYRDYGSSQHLLLIRILDRIASTSHQTGRDSREALTAFLYDWFTPINSLKASMPDTVKTKILPTARRSGHPPPLAPLHCSSMSSSASDTSSVGSGDEEDDFDTSIETWSIDGLQREDMDNFFAWAFFGKNVSEMESREHVEMDECFRVIEERMGLIFLPGSGGCYQPRRLSLEDVYPIHRPLLVYVAILLLKLAASFLLWALGYRRVVAKESGLAGWYRPAQKGSDKLLPLLFFHGIAPGGLVLYLPMILCGLAIDGRAVFLFENRSISCELGFQAVTERETVTGVSEIVNKHLGTEQDLLCCGHSFGSCLLTWLLYDTEFRDRIRQFVLLDPVTILLSEPDVMANFLYSRRVSKIRMLASSELFTEYYLRRHFSWYNSELWLDELPSQTHVLLALAERDEIVNAPKVKELYDLYRQEYIADRVQLIYWPGAGHASCVTSPKKWEELRIRMLQQELSISQQRT